MHAVTMLASVRVTALIPGTSLLTHGTQWRTTYRPTLARQGAEVN